MMAQVGDIKPDQATETQATGSPRHLPRSGFLELLSRGDLLVANDAATLPASLSGQHGRTGEPLELRLAGRRSLAPDGIRRCTAAAKPVTEAGAAPMPGNRLRAFVTEHPTD
jgi:S-adenosylmethionine:tRNA-ribosyltransferase-isomerase (queuine synthetase)